MKKPKPEGFGEILSKLKKGKPRPDLKGRVSPNKGKVSPNKNNHKSKPEGFGEHKYKSIIQYDLNMNSIKEWKSIKEAKLSTSVKNISLALVGANKTAGGYIWRYKI